MSTIIKAADDGDIDAVKKFLSSRTNVDGVDEDGSTALMAACFYGHLEIAKLLVENGANIKHQNKLKNTPLIYAVCKDELEVAKFILEHVDEDHVNHETCGGDTALRWAAKRGNVELAKLLLEKGADPYLINNFKRNAIEEATKYGNPNTANFMRSFHLNKMVAESREDLNEAKNKMGDIMNIKRDVQKLMELFQTHSQQLEELNKHMIEHQPQQELKEIVENLNQHLRAHSREDLLAWKGIENNLKDLSEFVREHHKKQSNQATKSLYHGLLLKDEDKLNCPIHSVVQYGFKEDIEAAVEKNQADKLKVFDSEGRTAMDLAALTGQLDVVEFLQCKGGVFHQQDPATMMAIARIRAADVDAYLDFARSTLKEYK